jgi:hypothetical protein
MRLKLSDLQKVVKETLKDKQEAETFCNEIKNVFGPSVIAKDDLRSLAEAANEKLDVLEYRGQLNTVNFSRKIAMSMSSHELPEVRKLAARVLPENASAIFLFDNDSSVRLAAAKKAPMKVLEEAKKKFPKDDALNDLFEEKKKEYLNAVEASASHNNEDMLSDSWYEGVAKKLIQDYGRTLDTTWVGSAVKQYCSTVRATTRLPVDQLKLIEKMKELLDAHDEARAEYLEINESFDYQESDQDPVDDMMKQTLSPQTFIDKCNEIFQVKYSSLPPAIMKYKLQEGFSLNKIPVFCTLPHGGAPRRIDELALDSYVRHWNDKQKIKGEPFKINWDLHPDSINKITFKVELK